jgi:hypothetical protein
MLQVYQSGSGLNFSFLFSTFVAFSRNPFPFGTARDLPERASVVLAFLVFNLSFSTPLVPATTEHPLNLISLISI